MNTSKSVKFNHNNEPPSGKKSFAKTPHSSKGVRPSDNSASPVLIKNKRKLSFSENASTGEIKSKPRLSEEEREKERIENTIFVGNLPIATNHKDLKECFSVFGRVLSARIRCLQVNPGGKIRKAAAILGDYRGDSVSAYVKFSSLNEAQRALAANGVKFEGHHLRVDMADSSQKKHDDKKAVYIRNIHYELTEDDLWKLFQNCGQISSVRLVKDKFYKPVGYGYVNFSSRAAVELALKMDETEVKGRKIRVYPCSNSKKSKKKIHTSGINAAKRIAIKGIKKKKKLEVAADDFAGKISSIKEKKRKKLNQTELKKKKLAEILTK